MASNNNKDDWLPHGWTVQFKYSNARKVKCYVHLETCQKFYSKPAVLRFIDGSVSNDNSHTSKEREKKNLVEQQMQRSVDLLGVQKNNPEASDWQISKTDNRETASSGREEAVVDRNMDEDLQSVRVKETKKKILGNPAARTDPVIVERTVDNDLPPGWIKEMRKKTRGNGVVRTDPFYLDPASDLVFRSKREVERYLDTGEISRHAYRRRNRSSNREELSFEKASPISVARKTTTKYRTGEQLFAGEDVPQESASLVAEAESIKESEVRRSNISFLGVRSASVGKAGLKQSAPDEAVSMTDILSKIQDAEEAEKSTIPMQIESPTSSRAVVMVENAASVAMQGCSNGKAQTNSFKESGVRRTRSSLSLRSASVDEANLNQSAFLLDQEKIMQEMLASKRIVKRCSSPDEAVNLTDISWKIQDADEKEKNTIPNETESPASSSRAIVTVGNPVSVTMQGSNVVKSQTSKRKRDDRKLLMPSRSSKRLAGVDSQVVFHQIPVEHALRASNKKSMGTKSVSSLVSLHNDLQEMPGLPDADTPNVLTCQEAKHHMLDIDTQSVLATQEKPGKNSESLMQDEPDVVDLQEQTPPGFSGNSIDEVLSKSIAQSSKGPRATVPDSIMQDDPQVVDLLEQTPRGFSGYLADAVSNSMVQSSEGPRHSVLVSEMDAIPSDHPTAQSQSNALLGRKVEKPAADFPVTEEQPGSIAKAAEPSTSDFSFAASFWSDPTLDFAYETLTDAISFDDNLAIEDYIQHQLRPSHRNDSQSLSDIDVSSFFPNDQTKVVPPLPGVRVPDSNGGSHKKNR